MSPPRIVPWLRASRSRHAQRSAFQRPAATLGPRLVARPAPSLGNWWQAVLGELESYLNGLLPDVLLFIRLHNFVAYVAAQAARA